MSLRFSGILFIFLSSPFLKANAESIDLESAVSRVLQKNPQIQFSRERLQETGSRLLGAWAKVAPTVTGQVAASHLKDAASSASARFGGDAFNLYKTELTASQPLFVRGILDGVGSEGSEEEIRRLDLEVSRRNLTLETLGVFFKVLLHQMQEETLKRSEQIHRESLQTATKRHQIGRGQLLDVLQMKTQLAMIRPDLERSLNNRKASLAELARLMGESETLEMNLRGQLSPPPVSAVEGAVKSYSREPLELKRQALLLKQFDEQRSAKLGTHWPSVYGSGAIGRTAFKKGDLFHDTNTAWSLGVSLSVPLFSGLSYWWDRQSLGSQERQLQWQEQSLRNDFSVKQVRALKDLQSSEVVVNASEEAVALAKAAVDEAKKNYRLATIDYLQLLQAEENLLKAELSFEQAKYDYIQLLGNYFSVNGYPIDLLVSQLTRPKGN